MDHEHRMQLHNDAYRATSAIPAFISTFHLAMRHLLLGGLVEKKLWYDG
jgi:hypothetical protein